MERIYKLNGEEKTLNEILSYLSEELTYNGDASKFESFGIDFEDEEDELYSLSIEELETIIEDYDFAEQVAERCYGLPINEVFDVFEKVSYHPYNYNEDELFDMEKGNLTLTYLQNGNLDFCIQVYANDDWINTDIGSVKRIYRARIQ